MLRVRRAVLWRGPTTASISTSPCKDTSKRPLRTAWVNSDWTRWGRRYFPTNHTWNNRSNLPHLVKSTKVAFQMRYDLKSTKIALSQKIKPNSKRTPRSLQILSGPAFLDFTQQRTFKTQMEQIFLWVLTNSSISRVLSSTSPTFSLQFSNCSTFIPKLTRAAFPFSWILWSALLQPLPAILCYILPRSTGFFRNELTFREIKSQNEVSSHTTLPTKCRRFWTTVMHLAWVPTLTRPSTATATLSSNSARSCSLLARPSSNQWTASSLLGCLRTIRSWIIPKAKSCRATMATFKCTNCTALKLLAKFLRSILEDLRRARM